MPNNVSREPVDVDCVITDIEEEVQLSTNPVSGNATSERRADTGSQAWDISIKIKAGPSCRSDQEQISVKVTVIKSLHKSQIECNIRVTCEDHIS